jgi:hypothetical protein
MVGQQLRFVIGELFPSPAACREESLVTGQRECGKLGDVAVWPDITLALS